MEGEQQQVQTNVPESVGFPQTQPSSKGGMVKWLILGIIILLVFGGGIFFLLRSTAETEDEEALETPSVRGAETFATDTPEPTSTSTPTPSPVAVDKSKIKIKVLNGTGITGEAGVLQSQLRTMGYTSVEVGNAPTQDADTTKVTYYSTVSKSAVDELSAKLKEMYKNVEIKSGDAGTADILIVTGLRKGATKAPATATAKPTTAPSSTTSPTTSPSATP